MNNNTFGFNEIDEIIKKIETKTDNVLDFAKIQAFIVEKLPKNYGFYKFYKQIIEILQNNLFRLSNDINKYFKNDKKELNYFYKVSDIFFCISCCCVGTEIPEIVDEEKIRNLISIFINIFYKLNSIKEENKNLFDFPNSINTFIEYIYKLFQLLFSINLELSIKIIMENNNNYHFLLSHTDTRIILYKIEKYIIKFVNDKQNEQKKEYIKGKQSIIIDIIDYLNNNYKENVIIIFEDIKQIALTFKNNITIIYKNFMTLIKKVLDDFNSELNNKYQDLFLFFFNEIVFEENINQSQDEKNICYNKKFLDFLFDLYIYLIKGKKKELYNIFIICLFNSVTGNDIKEWKKQGRASKIYKWLLTETAYIKIILDSFPDIFNDNIFAFYSATLITLSNNNDEKDPTIKIDLIYFIKNFHRYLDNKEYKREYIIEYFSKKIIELINSNTKIINCLIRECNLCEEIIKIIDTEKDHNIQIKLLNFIEKILSVSKGKLDYILNIKIRSEINDLNLKINLISIGYEPDDNKYNEKIKELIEIMNNFSKEKKIKELLQIINIIFNNIINYKFKKINAISDENLLNLDNLLLQISCTFSNLHINDLTDCEKKLEELVIMFLNSIYTFIYHLNMKKFEYKIQNKFEKKPIYFTKRIIEKKILKNIIKNMLLSQNHIIKKKTFEYLINFSIDQNNNLIISSYILYIVMNIYYQDKNYKNLNKIFIILLNSVKDLELNAKILLNYDFISITIDVLQELNIKNNDTDECYKSAFLFLEEICKYLNQQLLMNYLNKLFIIFNKNVLSKIGENKKLENENTDKLSIEKRNNINETNFYDNIGDSLGSINSNDNGRENIGRYNNLETFDLENDISDTELINNRPNTYNEEESNNENDINNNKSKICFDLFNLIKKYLKLNNDNINDFINNNTSNYIIISNYSFPNPLINNLLFLENLKYNNFKDIYVYFKIILKINTYNGIKDFFLLQLRDGKSRIIFSIIQNNILEIKETGKEYKKTLYKIENFDQLLPADNKYHNCIIVFNTQEKHIHMEVDNKIIITKSNQYNYFTFDNFNVFIGYRASSIDKKTNDINSRLTKLESNNDEMTKTKNNVCFIFISYLLILNTLIQEIEEKSLINSIKKERKYTPNPSLMSYFYRTKNRNWGQNIIAEIDFQNKNIDLIYSKEIKNKGGDTQKYFLTNNNIFINQYIPYIKTSFFLNDDLRDYSLYMISRNKNIDEYYSLNNICELERLNKSKICSKIYDNYDINISVCNNYVFDFLFGFFFLIEKRFNELKNNEDIEENKKDDEGLGFSLYGNSYLANEEIVIEYILELFEIIINIPCQNIRNLLIKGDSSNSNIIKLKYFFFRNISLLNNNESFVEKILRIFYSENENEEKKIYKKILFIKILNEIFLNSIIFEKLHHSIQNNILLHLIDLLNKSENIQKEKENKYLYKLVKKLIFIILFNDLSLIENNEGKTQIDLIFNCIQLIICKAFTPKDKTFEEKLNNLFLFLNINLSNDLKYHLNFELSNYNYIFSSSENEYNEEDIKNKLNKRDNQVKTFFNLISKDKYCSYYILQKNDTKECFFCNYLKELFFIKYNFIYKEFKYDKLYNYFFRSYFLNFGDNTEIFGNKKYAWFLSFKESYSKMQNKLFLKENHIKKIAIENPNSKKITNYFKYDYGKEKYKKTFKELYKLHFIDKISIHRNLVDDLDNNSSKEDKYIYNCLVVNKLRKTLSIIILNKDCLQIYNNLFLDNNKKINIVFSETTHSLWFKNKQDFKKELNEYIKKNEEQIKEEIYEINAKDKNTQQKKNSAKFYYSKSYKFSKKIIDLKKINEIYKKQHLHLPNSLEFLLNNGESYFIVLTTDNRDILFDQIIKNINDLYKDKQNKLEIFKNSKLSSSNNKENYIYIKHFPILSLNQPQEVDIFEKKMKKKKNIKNINSYKVLIDGNVLKDEICNNWSKNKVNNYDYLMLLNILAGRTLNDLSQYFIFPWLIKDFNVDILNWLSNKIYRDLSLPIHVCGKDKEEIINKFNLDDEKYHSGTFYSTHSFVCYFLIRLRPFTEVHLEIQGAKFDTPLRMFNGVEQLSNVTEKYQELIPPLFYLPELFIKTNSIFEGDNEKDKEPFNDYILPDWSKNDPRKFTLILKKILESKKISENLNSWIDLIFGYKQKGEKAIKALNVFRNACYPSPKNELERMDKNKELESYMYEKEELGCVGKQLFNKAHKYKEVNIENIKLKRIFFNDSEKLKKLKIKKIKNHKKINKNDKKEKDNINLDKKDIINDNINIYKIEKNNIKFDKINDIIFDNNSPLNNINKEGYYQGGICSLPSIMNSLKDNHEKDIDYNKIIKIIEEENNFILLNINYRYLYKFNLILTYNKKCIELINIINNEAYFYYLNEIGDISSLIINEQGDKMFVGFSNGIINQYKIVNILSKEKVNESDYIYTICPSQLTKESEEFKNIYYNNMIDFHNFINNNETKIYLKLISQNNFTNNNPHYPQKIKLLSLNEFHNVLIALDELNLLYIISLNNNSKLMHISYFLTNIHYKMKEILPLPWNGDFIIYSSYSVYLFSINGIPLCQLNLFDKIHENLYNITCCKAVFINEITIFTGHKDGTIIIWKINNKNTTEKFEERISFVFNSKKSKFFLPEYSYGYNSKHNRYNEGKINEYELQRKFEIVTKICINKESQNYITFMKMSKNLDYMILFDNEKNLYVLFSNLDDISKNNFAKKKSKDKCSNCNKKLIDQGIRPTLVNINGSLCENNSFEIIDEESNNDKDVICEECKQKLQHTENFLYNY